MCHVDWMSQNHSDLNDILIQTKYFKKTSKAHEWEKTRSHFKCFLYGNSKQQHCSFPFWLHSTFISARAKEWSFNMQALVITLMYIWPPPPSVLSSPVQWQALFCMRRRAGGEPVIGDTICKLRVCLERSFPVILSFVQIKNGGKHDSRRIWN